MSNQGFPSNKYEYLTCLYLKKLDISKLTPQELLEKYNQVYSEIYELEKDKHKGQIKTHTL